MSSETIYYRSDAPAAQEWLTELKRRQEPYREAFRALMADYPGFGAVQHSGIFGCLISGLVGEAYPGDGWRKNAEGYWVPDKRLAAGRRLVERLGMIVYNYPTLPGMPDWVCSRCPGWATYGDVLWAIWSISPEQVEAEPKFDASIWQRAKTSAFHLAKEADEQQEQAHVE